MLSQVTQQRRTAFCVLAWLVVIMATALPAPALAQEGVPCATEPTDMVVAYGDVVDCSIEVVGDTDTFRFSATAGEVIAVQAVIGSPSSVRPCLTLVAPDASQLLACANAFVNRIDTMLTQTGTYTILVRDQPSAFTGHYTLVLERILPPSAKAKPISYGQTLVDQINISGDVDLFFFSGSQGDVISIRVANVSPSSVRPCLELITPANTRQTACNNAFNNELQTTLGQSGVFVALARDMPNTFTGNYSIVLQCLAGQCVPGTGVSAPTGLTASVAGSTVTLNWLAPTTGPAPTSYVIEAGSATGLANLAAFDTGNTQTSFSAITVPPGTYFVRVRARNSSGTSAPSNETVVNVGGGGCVGPPGPPGVLTFTASGLLVTLNWSGASGQPTTYVVDAGSSPGASDLASFPTGNTATTLSANVVPGTYFVRVRARNACGTSAPTNEVVIAVGGPPGAPSGLTFSLNGSIVMLSWNAASGQPTTYVIEVGSTSGASDLANFPSGSTATTLTGTAPPGTYFIRVRARNAGGTSGPSNEVVVTIP
jgi:hypothetical protein